jgi:ribose transport system substrate-binding protein
MRSVRRYAAALAAVSVAAIAAACGSSDEVDTAGGKAEKELRIAFFNGFNGNSFAAAEVAAAKAEAAKRGASVEVLGAPTDPSVQISQIQDAVTSSKFDAFVIFPVDGNALVGPVEQAVGAGIHVAATFNTVGRDIGSVQPGVKGMVAMVGEPMVASGTNIATAIAQACEGISPCKVVYLPGSFKQATEVIRTKAVHAYLKDHPNVKIVAEREGGYLQQPALQVTTDVLRAHRDVSVIATSGDQMTLGVEKAVHDAGLTGKVKLIGNAASEQGVQAVREGRWFATPVYLPRTEAMLATRYVIQAARGERVPVSTNVLDLSPVGPIVTRKSLETAKGKSFKGEWKA